MSLTKQDIQRVKLEGFLHNRGTECFNCRIITGNGTLTGEQLRIVADIAERYHTRCTFTTRLTVEIVGVPYEDIEKVKAELAAAGMITGGTGARVRPVTACKGTTCVFGFYDTQALGKKVHDRFYVGMGDVRLPHKFKIAVGGCPNNCVKPDLNDFGIVGQRPPLFDPELCRGCKVCQIEKNCRMSCCTLKDGKMARDENICNNCGYCIGKCPFQAVTPSDVRYKCYIGGRWGRITRFGTPLPGLYTEEETLDMIEKAILLFRDRGRKGERFAAMIDRIGEEEAINALLHGDLLARREAILAREL
ncbi:MAG: (4Fe-4S)-binding protein [Clostridiaceae bacterium]|nr:(4Fe-4S)-binding protein [Clostridiaceae bacterium]